MAPPFTSVQLSFADASGGFATGSRALAAGAISVGGGGSSIVSPARPAASTCTAWFCCSVIFWPCDVSSWASPVKILTPVAPPSPTSMFPLAFSSAVVFSVGVTISVDSWPTAKLTRPDCTRQAAVEASAEPPMYTTLSERTLTTLPELKEISAPARVSVCTTSPTCSWVGERRPRLQASIAFGLTLTLPSTPVRRAICWPGFGTGLRTKKYQ